MSGHANARRRFLPPSPSPESNNGIRTPTGLGVPVAPSFLELDEEETVTYAGPASPPPPSRPRESFHTAPVFPEDLIVEPVAATPVESNLHQIEANQITNSLAPSAPRRDVSPRRGQ